VALIKALGGGWQGLTAVKNPEGSAGR
jgi:hypothetical protein